MATRCQKLYQVHTKQVWFIWCCKTNVHHYEQIIRPRVEATGTSDPIEEVTVEVDYASYVAAGEGNRKIVYDYDYELDKNEAKRQINLVQPVFVSTILDEARQTFR